MFYWKRNYRQHTYDLKNDNDKRYVYASIHLNEQDVDEFDVFIKEDDEFIPHGPFPSMFDAKEFIYSKFNINTYVDEKALEDLEREIRYQFDRE